MQSGQSSMTWFCSTMNMPPAVGSKPFRAHTKALLQAAKDVTEQHPLEGQTSAFNLRLKKS